MSKLMECLAIITILGAIWYGLITQKIQNNFDETVMLFSPIVMAFLVLFYSATIVLYRTLTFNDCEEAAAELRKEIAEAEEDLKRSGFPFKK